MTPVSRAPFSSSELIRLRMQTANPAVEQGRDYRGMVGAEMRRKQEIKCAGFDSRQMH